MDIREKLVELIAQKVCGTWSESCDEWLPHDCGKCYANDCRISEIADHLIINGVTVQEWISVDDRIPDEDGKYLVWFGKSAFGQYAKVISFAKDGDTVDKYDLHNEKNVWFYDDSEIGYVACHDVTHWMPLPSTEGLE